MRPKKKYKYSDPNYQGKEEYREKILKCPFCETVQPPAEQKEVGYEEFEGNLCPGCGAVYVYDRSGLKMGEAFMQALLYAYDGDYDAALSAPEGSYEEFIIKFDTRSNKYFDGNGPHTKDRLAKYHFVRRKQV